MRLAVVSPLPPARSGVADYAARLNRELEGAFEIVASESAGTPELQSCDAALYHLGNNRLHAGAYQAALAHPGTVVLHDAVLHHFYLGHLSREKYVEEFIYNQGEWSRECAMKFWRDSGASESDERYFRYPMLRRIVEHSKGIVVHNPKARRMVEQAAELYAPGLRIFEIPHFVELPPVVDPASHTEMRKKLGVEEEAIIIACLGFLRPSKRVPSLFDAVRSLDIRYRLLLAGEFTSSDYENSVLRRAHRIHLRRLPYLPEHDWAKVIATADVCVNLRYPSAGETSGIVMRMMAMGKPVVVTEGQEVAGLPAHTVIRVDHGEAEVEMLAEFLRALSHSADMRESIGSAARKHVTEHHSIDQVAKQYVEAVRAVAAST